MGVGTLPQVSILMPVKNAMPYLTECLESIVAQSYQEWQLIAINDHSADGSRALLKTYAAKDARITTYDNNGKGIIDALRLAYTHSDGHYITRMDADDIMRADKLQVLINNLKRRGKGYLAVGQVEYFSETTLGEGYKKYADWLNGLTALGSNFDDLYRECVIPSPCWMVHREDLDRIGAFSSDRYPEDYDLTFRMYQGGLKCIPCHEPIHLWRDHGERSSRNDDNYSDNRFLDIKLHHFIGHDHNPSRPLVIWGAGRKGKQIVKSIQQRVNDLYWICDNPNKIGHNIYGLILSSPELITQLTQAQIIIAVANPEEQERILQMMRSMELETMKDYYFFC